jgi:hypothetical protein
MEEFPFYFNTLTGVSLATLGIIGNLLVIIVYMSKKLRSLSMSHYLVVLAFCDFIELISRILLNVSTIWGASSEFCKIDVFFMLVFFQFCSNISVVVSIDRLLSVKFIRRCKIKDSLKFKIALLFFALSITMPIGITNFVFIDAVAIANGTGYCSFVDLTVSSTVSTLNLFISTIIPFFTMVTCTLIMWRTLSKLKKKLLRPKTDTKREFQMFKTMIGIDCFFFICNSPICLYLIITSFRPQLFNLLAYNVFNLISIFHNTFSILVHIICNKVFREEFFIVILRKKPNSVRDSRS